MREKAIIGLAFLAALLMLIAPSGSYSQDDRADEPKEEKKGARVDLSSFQPWAGAAAGFGTQYGGLGGNLEVQLHPVISLTAGLGNSEGFSMVLGGLRFYIPTSNEKFQFRISALGGNVAILEEERYWGDDKTIRKNGFAVGFGSLLHATDNIYLNSGIYYVNAGTYRDGYEEKTLQAATFSVGIGVKFDLPQAEKPRKSRLKRR
jgi:opacity protein-like surface antigen